MHNIYNHFSEAFEARLCAPRTYKPLRQRARARFAGDTKYQSARRTGKEDMDKDNGDGPPYDTAEPQWDNVMDRTTLCLPSFSKDAIVHAGDEGFKDVIRQYFPSAESHAAERLVDLKSRLRTASTHDFWGMLMEEMCDITGSQCGFVAKRMLVDDQDSAVEMPELGEPGSCLMGIAFYINNGADVKELHRDYRYHAYGSPCAHMKHDKVFIVPERLKEVVPDNPNTLPWQQSEAFIGVPLFTDGKCFAHFGMVWSTEGASKRKLGWNFMEMFMHSLEDMILQRILEGRGFAKEVTTPELTPPKVIPLSAITACQSLKPYARSLSHELRTPMQGVVGMLDIMYSTVLDAIDNQQSERVRSVFKDLKGHIEVVQDSSKRAVEAADNVVHAYDLNMQMPETPLTPEDLDKALPWSGTISPQKQTPPPREIDMLPSPMSRKRERSEELDFHPGPPLKRMFAMTEAEIIRIYCSDDTAIVPLVPISNSTTSNLLESHMSSPSGHATYDQKLSPVLTPTMLNPTHRRVVTREFMCGVLHEALRSGHPTKEVHTNTELGEKIEVRTLGSRGEVQDRTVHLEIEPDVPEVIITEEHHLQFSLQKIVDNAIKFTDSGSITVTVKLGRNSQVIEVWVVDTGCGIAEESKQNLFKPHFQEDASISRARDGLGLSLFNAKAHIRRNLGGDVTLERSATDGPCKGSEFLIRLPISAFEANTAAPVVGTSLPTHHQPYQPFPWKSSMSPIIQVNPGFSGTTSPPTTSPPSGLISRKSPPKITSRKRIAFNKNLSKDYPLNILIAEDNAINRNVAVGSLKKLGYSDKDITVAFDGVEALEHYKVSLSKPASQRFNTILMDIWMPNMDGYEATTKILDLAGEVEDVITIVAVTADITSESMERSKALGMQGFLAKPYKVLDIERLIIEHFEKRGTEEK